MNNYEQLAQDIAEGIRVKMSYSDIPDEVYERTTSTWWTREDVIADIEYALECELRKDPEVLAVIAKVVKDVIEDYR